MQSQSDFSNNQDHIQSEQVYKKPKKQMNYQSSINSGPWTQQQNLKYINFVNNHRQSLTSRSKRRFNKIFKQMSIFIQTRNAIQCRSHHQKQLDKLKNISKIISTFQKTYHIEEFSQKAQQDISQASKKDSIQFKKSNNQLFSEDRIKNDLEVKKILIQKNTKQEEAKSFLPYTQVGSPKIHNQGSINYINWYGLFNFPINYLNLWNCQYYGAQY